MQYTDYIFIYIPCTAASRLILEAASSESAGPAACEAGSKDRSKIDEGIVFNE